MIDSALNRLNTQLHGFIMLLMSKYMGIGGTTVRQLNRVTSL